MAFVAAFGVTVMAQDTIATDTLKGSYFHNRWFDQDTLLLSQNGYVSFHFSELAFAYHTDDTMKVYGVAISSSLDTNIYGNTWLDTTLDKVYRTVRLYVPEGDSLRMLAERQFYIKDAEVAYYMAMNKRDLFMPDSTLKPFPVYELFFDSPVAVKDTFYIGFNYETNCKYLDPTLGRVFNYKYTMTINGFLQSGRKDTVTRAQRRTEESPNYDQGTWLIRTRIAPQTIVFLYAITEPGDGTSGGGSGSDTTLTITASDAAARYVSVQPNPAVDEARVLSSLGLRGIEAYNAGGQKVYEGKAEGLEATLDVKGWPRGTYLLRITTPMGTVTKKLLVE